MPSFESLLGLEDDVPEDNISGDELEEDELRARNCERTRRNSDSESASEDSDREASENEEEHSSNEEVDHPLDFKPMQLLNQTGKPLTVASLKKFQDRIDKTGVVYLSRIPPFMKHTKLRSLLTQYAEVGRIYLNPEDAKIAARRKKYKHNKRVNYTEGWVEFVDKGMARKIAEKLNNQPIGGKKRSYYHDDIWNIKYLPKFKWNNLSEQLAYEIKVREQKLRTEMAQAKRENNMFVKHVQQAKMISAMEEKKKKRGVEETEEAEDKKLKRRFKQRKPALDQDNGPASTSKSNLLSKIFG
jgi:ESF2/ABP1 family protein